MKSYSGLQFQFMLGTDRHNMLEMEAFGKSIPFFLNETKFWGDVTSLTDPKATFRDISIGLATSGFFCGIDFITF